MRHWIDCECSLCHWGNRKPDPGETKDQLRAEITRLARELAAMTAERDRWKRKYVDLLRRFEAVRNNQEAGEGELP